MIMRTKIQGSYVVAFDGQSHQLIKDGVVVYEDDKIIYTGKSYTDPVDKTIVAPGRLISPGLINIHCLASLCLTHLRLDGSGAGLAVSKEYAVDGIGNITLEGNDQEISSKFSVANILKGGATTFGAITPMAGSRFEGPKDEANSIAQTAGKMGARAYVSHNYRSGLKYQTKDGATAYHWDEEAGHKGLEAAIQFAKRIQGSFDGRINSLLFPYQLETCTPELLQATNDSARDLGIGKRMHTSQYLAEFHELKKRHGKTPTRLLADIGFLDQQTILTHMIWTTSHFESGYPFRDVSELELIAKAGTTVATCPVIYSRSGQILYSFGLYQRMGINLTIGSDAFPQDILREMRYAALLSKIAERDRIGVTARDVYNAVTVNGAKALNRNDIGRLSPGAKADIVIFDLRPLNMGLIDDPIKSIVYWGSQDIVETVIVDGNVVVANHQIPGLDEEALAIEANEVNQKQKQRFVAQNTQGLSVDDLFPPSFKTL